MIRVGDPVPPLYIKLDSGEELNLAKVGKPLVLFFYPKAFSPVCTAEACKFRDLASEFASAGAVIYGVSRDPAKVQRDFEEHHLLPYPSISDRDGEIEAAFGVNGVFNLPKRVTVVADAAGQVALVYSNQLNPFGHPQKALQAVKLLSQADEGTLSGSDG